MLTTQFWYSAHADRLDKDQLPFVVGLDNREEYRFDDIKDPEQRKGLNDFVEKMATGKPFFDSNSKYRGFDVSNANFSKCYECKEISVWIFDRLIYPMKGTAPAVNVDTPEEIKTTTTKLVVSLLPRQEARQHCCALPSRNSARNWGNLGKTSTTTLALLSVVDWIEGFRRRWTSCA